MHRRTEDPNATWHFLPTYKVSLIERLIDGGGEALALFIALLSVTFFALLIFACVQNADECTSRRDYEKQLSTLNK